MRLLDSLMQSQGFEIIFSIGGADALELVHEHHPDLIILDIVLPFLSGFEIVQLLKRGTRLVHVPVTTMTAYATLADEDKFLGKSFNGYLAKPVSTLDILEMVAGFFKSAEPSCASEASALRAAGQTASV